MADIPGKKRNWPDGVEHIVDGAVVFFGAGGRHSPALPVNELPKEVRAIMRASKEDMITLHHHADPEVEVYIDPEEIIAIDARWRRLDDDE